MADSSARNLNYQQSQQQTEQPKKAIVLNPKSVPWTAFEKSLVVLGSLITLDLIKKAKEGNSGCCGGCNGCSSVNQCNHKQ